MSAALSAPVIVADRADCHHVRADLERLLREQYGITHVKTGRRRMH